MSVTTKLVFAAPFADGDDFLFGDVEEFEEFLVVGGGGALELLMPAVHVGFGEAGGFHYCDPFIFRHFLRALS